MSPKIARVLKFLQTKCILVGSPLTNLEKVPRELLHFVCILCDWKKKKEAFNHATNGEWPHTNNVIYKKECQKFECIGVGNIIYRVF
jgi:hypothetical protein